MYSKIQLSKLRNMLVWSREAKEFDMRRYWCGTTGCHIGTYCYKTNQIYRLQCYLISDNTEEFICEEFGVPMFSVYFLFVSSLYDDRNPSNVALPELLSQQKACNRLEKYIKYIERKQ